MDGCDEKLGPESVVRAFVDAWNRLDMDAVGALFSPHIEYHNIPLAPITGKAEVNRYLRSVGPFETCEWRILTLAVSGQAVLTERIDAFTVRGRSIVLPVMGVFEVEGGLIRRWRDYFDLASYRAQWPAPEQSA